MQTSPEYSLFRRSYCQTLKAVLIYYNEREKAGPTDTPSSSWAFCLLTYFNLIIWWGFCYRSISKRSQIAIFACHSLAFGHKNCQTKIDANLNLFCSSRGIREQG